MSMLAIRIVMTSVYAIFRWAATKSVRLKAGLLLPCTWSLA